jgi:hypothetical protein
VCDDARIEGLSSEIEALARQDKGCERLMSVPGIGPVISSAMVAAIGAGDAFSKGRDFGAWLGLVPKQLSTGDRTILCSISKRGNRYLRSLFVQATWVVWSRSGQGIGAAMGSSREAARKRLHHNVLALALANKLARIAWAVLHKGRAFECVKTNEAASRQLVMLVDGAIAAALVRRDPTVAGAAREAARVLLTAAKVKAAADPMSRRDDARARRKGSADYASVRAPLKRSRSVRMWMPQTFVST